MNRSEYADYLKSTRWKNLSKKVRQRAGWRCQLCNSTGELHCHHRSYENVGTNKEQFDLIALCKRCHVLIHMSKLHTEQALIVNRVGSLLIDKFENCGTDFESYLFRTMLRYLGVLHYVINDDMSSPLLFDLREYLQDQPNKVLVWGFVKTFLFDTAGS